MLYVLSDSLCVLKCLHDDFIKVENHQNRVGERSIQVSSKCNNEQTRILNALKLQLN